MTELARELAQVTEELEGVKAEMDEKGTSMTDAGPLVKIKQALTRLKNECVEMQVRTGVVSFVCGPHMDCIMQRRRSNRVKFDVVMILISLTMKASL